MVNHSIFKFFSKKKIRYEKKVERRKKKSRVIIWTDIMPKMAVKRNKDGKLELFCTKTRFKF